MKYHGPIMSYLIPTISPIAFRHDRKIRAFTIQRRIIQPSGC